MARSRRGRSPRSNPPSDVVRAEWLRRVDAEYRSAAITQHLGLWLIQIGAPPDLISDSLRIVRDEMVHAELSHAVFVKAGGARAPNLDRDTLGLSRSREPLEHDVLRHGVEVFCLGETIAVRLFKRLRQGATVAVARRALDRVLKDEVRHRDFGWTLLEWLLSTPRGPELRRVLSTELPAMLGRVRRNYEVVSSGPGAASAVSVFANADRAWGLMPVSEYADAVTETFARDYTPRFAALDIAI